MFLLDFFIFTRSTALLFQTVCLFIKHLSWLIRPKFPEGWDYALYLFSRGPFVQWKHQDTFKLIKGRAQFQMVSLRLRCDILNLFTRISVNALWRGFQVFLSHQCGSENLDGNFQMVKIESLTCFIHLPQGSSLDIFLLKRRYFALQS